MKTAADAKKSAMAANPAISEPAMIPESASALDSAHVREVAMEKARELNRIAKSLIQRNRPHEASNVYQAKRRVLLHLICVHEQPFGVAGDDSSLLCVGGRRSLHLVRHSPYLFPSYETRLNRLVHQTQRIIHRIRADDRPLPAIRRALQLARNLSRQFPLEPLCLHLGEARDHVRRHDRKAALPEAFAARKLAKQWFRCTRDTPLSLRGHQLIDGAIEQVEHEVGRRVAAPSLVQLFEAIDATPYSTRQMISHFRLVQQVGSLSRRGADDELVRSMLRQLRSELLEVENTAAMVPPPLSLVAKPAAAPRQPFIEPTRKSSKPSQRILARVTVRQRTQVDDKVGEPSGNSLRVSLLLEKVMRLVAACGGTAVYPRAVAQGSGCAKVVVIYSAELEHHEQISRRVTEEFERPELKVIAQRNLALVAIRAPRDVDVREQVAECFAQSGCRIVQTMHGNVPSSVSPEGEVALCYLVSRRVGSDPDQLAERVCSHLGPRPDVHVVVKDPASVFTNRSSDAEDSQPPLAVISKRTPVDCDKLVTRSVIVDHSKNGLMTQVIEELAAEGAGIIAPVSYMRDDRKRAVEVMYETSLKGMLRINASISRRQSDWKVRTQFLCRSRETVSVDIDCGSFAQAAQTMSELLASRNLLLLETLPTVYPEADQIRLSFSAVASAADESTQLPCQPR